MELIILNGSPGAGKSTLAAQLHKDYTFSLLADVDVFRRMIGGWETRRAESLKYAYHFTLAAVDAHLQQHNVIVDKAILNHDDVIDQLHAIGTKHKARVFEFILTAEKETILARVQERRKNSSMILATDEQVLGFWNVTQELIAKRPQAIVVDTTLLSPAQVYEKVKAILT